MTKKVNCEFQPAVTDAEISEALDGNHQALLRSNPARDVTTCAACLARQPHSCLQRWQDAYQFEKHLQAKLYRLDCPTTETLMAYLHGNLDPQRAKTIAEHTQECVLCRTELQHLRAYMTPSTERGYRPAPLRSPNFWIGQLSRNDDPLTGIRGEQTHVTSVKDVTVIVEHERATADSWRITGQILTESEIWADALVNLQSIGEATITQNTMSDDIGEFTFEHIQAVSIVLKITGVDGITILLPQIDLIDE